MKGLENLLQDVRTIIRQDNLLKPYLEDRFNVFETLGIESREKELHSTFIGNLLHPKGKHNNGLLYLQAFCELLGIEGFYYKGATVEVEKYIGRRQEDSSFSGFIDIVVSDIKGYQIIIENKIYAGDQIGQLSRYESYARQSSKNYTILYLTLHGHNASEVSLNGLSTEKIKKVTYEKDILKWLALCLEKASNFPTERETIKQYSATIKKLTNQTTILTMKSEIPSTIAKNGANFKAALEISRAIKQSKSILLQKFLTQLRAGILNLRPGLEIEIDPNFGNDSIHGFSVKKTKDDRHYVWFSMLGEQAEFYLEVVNLDNRINTAKKTVEKNIENIAYFEKNLVGHGRKAGKIVTDIRTGWHGDWVMRYTSLDDKFWQDETWEAIADGETVDLIVQTSELIIVVLEAVEGNATKV